MTEIPKVINQGIAKFKDKEVLIVVLDNKMRVMVGDGTGKDAFLGLLPSYIDTYQQQNAVLVDFMDIEGSLVIPQVKFKNLDGKEGIGYNCLVIAEIADSYQKYKDYLTNIGKPIPDEYKEAIKFSEDLMINLAYIGINALIDEATGYQAVRKKTDLQDLLQERVEQ